MRAILRVFLVMASLIATAAVGQVMSAEPDATKSDAKPEAPLAYISVAGAPGDGGQALAAALGKRLSAAGVKTASALDTSVYSVEAIVKVTAANGGQAGCPHRLDRLWARRRHAWRGVADQASAQRLAR
jgi:hypothetical protein